jgi:hypothetical protein
VERQLRAGVMLSAIQERHAQGIAVEHGFVAPLQAGLQLAAEEEQGGGSEDVLQACRAWGESAGGCRGISGGTSIDDGCCIQARASWSWTMWRTWSRTRPSPARCVCVCAEAVRASQRAAGQDALQDIREGRLSQMLFALRRLASPEEWEEVAQVLGGGEVHPMTLFDRRRTLDLLSRHRIVRRFLPCARLTRRNVLRRRRERWSPRRSTWPRRKAPCCSWTRVPTCARDWRSSAAGCARRSRS